MTAPLPENIRRAGADALEELATRMSRGATNLFKQAMRLRIADPNSQREALCQLRRYQNFGMPGFEQVGIIEGALMGLTEPESRALTERRQRKQYQSTIRVLSERLSERETRPAKPRRKRRQKGNVVAGPWGAGGEARP